MSRVCLLCTSLKIMILARIPIDFYQTMHNFWNVRLQNRTPALTILLLQTKHGRRRLACGKNDVREIPVHVWKPRRMWRHLQSGRELSGGGPQVYFDQQKCRFRGDVLWFDVGEHQQSEYQVSSILSAENKRIVVTVGSFRSHMSLSTRVNLRNFNGVC